MMKPSDSVRIVLVRPRNPLNLLAASRAAANFGFCDVVVVAPYEPVWEEARAAAGAARWLRQTRRAADLLEAIEDRNWVLGTSCLARRRLDPSRVLSLNQVSARVTGGNRRDRIAILFGSEKRGLSNHHLELCHSIIRIPTLQTSPSMNLGQAVAVCCYELRRAGGGSGRPASADMSVASAGEVDRLVEAIGSILPNAEPGEGRRQGKMRKRQARLRRMLMRLPVSREEISLALGVVRDLAWRLQKDH
jgi:tRNA/rRNA methyltransferase